MLALAALALLCPAAFAFHPARLGPRAARARRRAAAAAAAAARFDTAIGAPSDDWRRALDSALDGFDEGAERGGAPCSLPGPRRRS